MKALFSSNSVLLSISRLEALWIPGTCGCVCWCLNWWNWVVMRTPCRCRGIPPSTLLRPTSGESVNFIHRAPSSSSTAPHSEPWSVFSCSKHCEPGCDQLVSAGGSHSLPNNRLTHRSSLSQVAHPPSHLESPHSPNPPLSHSPSPSLFVSTSRTSLSTITLTLSQCSRPREGENLLSLFLLINALRR